MKAAMRATEGAILIVDVGNFSVEKLGEIGDFPMLLGGRGLSQGLLLERLPKHAHPLDADSPIAIGAGLLCGTGAIGAVRLSVDGLNLFTGGIASSNAGGLFAGSLRRAGIAALLVTGQAAQPVILCARDGWVTIEYAQELWGRLVPSMHNELRARYGKACSTLGIGPAGERQCWSATTVVDGAHTAGRCGTGALFGSKGVKAIVACGGSPLGVADRKAFNETTGEIRQKLMESPFNKRRMHYGVYCYEEPWIVESPYRNFSGKAVPEAKKRLLSPDAFLEYLTGRQGCEGCPIRCRTTHTVTEQSGVSWTCEGLQGNDPDNFGLRLDLDDPRDVLRCHKLCNDFGLDVDVVSSTIAWAISCAEDGLLTQAETGRPLSWGKADLIFELIEEIAQRKGIGDLLADGCLRASRQVGGESEKYCHHVRGNDLFECLWEDPAWAFGTVLSPRGGTHTRGAVLTDRMDGIPDELARKWYGDVYDISSHNYNGVERLVIHQERFNAALDALGICFFLSSGCPDMLLPEEVARLASAVTGWNLTEDDLLEIGERIHTQERSLNIIRGLPGREGDLPPEHFVDVPLAGKYSIDRIEWDRALDRYYKEHGWDNETGWPTQRKLRELGLDKVIERLPSQ
jgi:aldehyde:ferredoxin oxidoreductase